MNTTSDYQISTASRAEVDIAVDWAAAEGWNPGLGDAEAYYRADPSGFLIGRLHGEPVATISAVRYGDFGFMGFYIVRPAERGRGLGIAIWNAALRHLEGCTVGLDGVVAQQVSAAGCQPEGCGFESRRSRPLVSFFSRSSTLTAMHFPTSAEAEDPAPPPHHPHHPSGPPSIGPPRRV